MARRASPTLCSDEAHHLRQRLHRGLVAMQHLEHLTVVRTDTHLEPHSPGVCVGDHAAHLQAGHLTGQHAELDHRLGTAGADVGLEAVVRGGHIGSGGQGLDDGGQ